MLAMRDMELVVASTRRSHGSTGLRVTSLLDHYRPQERRVRDGGDASETMLAATPGRGRPPSAYGTRGTPIGAADRPCPQARRRAFRPGSSTALGRSRGRRIPARPRPRGLPAGLCRGSAVRASDSSPWSPSSIVRPRRARNSPTRFLSRALPSCVRRYAVGRACLREVVKWALRSSSSRSACCSPALQRRPTSPSVGHSAVAAMLPTGIEPVHAV
jgi:hypothetical protein